MKEHFYKIAKPDGWDFYTGKTINYRDSVGRAVRRRSQGKLRLCSSTAIHASRDPNQCFIGGGLPCSLYRVEGKPFAEDKEKCGFKQLRIVKELNPEKTFKWRYREAYNPVHPFKIKPPKKITEKHIKLLRQWDSVRDSVWYSVGNSVWDSVGDSVGDSVRDSVRYSVWDSVWDSVGNSVWDSVGDSVRDSVRYSVWDSVGDYIGYIFAPVVKKWKYIDHKPGEYPFRPTVDLWKMGLVPSFDGEKWRLHGGEKAKILWGGKL